MLPIYGGRETHWFDSAGTYIVYEMLWACNVSLVLVVMALYLSKPFLVGVAVRALFLTRLGIAAVLMPVCCRW
jgi:hypothetical protein